MECGDSVAYVQYFPKVVMKSSAFSHVLPALIPPTTAR